MEITTNLITQQIYDWINQHKVNLEELYNDFCIETNNTGNTDFTTFCNHVYLESKYLVLDLNNEVINQT